MKTHELKILPQYFEKVLDGSKTFEIRKDDRGFEVGDILVLKEFQQGSIDCTQGEPIEVEKRGYTGRVIEKEISYIFNGGAPGMGLRKEFSILALKDIKKSTIDKKEVLSKIYDLILLFDKEYGRTISIETLEIMNNNIGIESIEDLLIALECNSPD